MKFSVLMSVYAKEKAEYLAQSLQSLSDQTLKADEVVLVEDGPIGSDLAAVIERFRSSLNLISVRFKDNSGLAVALNQGLKHCTHNLVARMDSDDISLPRRFEKQLIEFQKNPNLDVIGCFAREIDAIGNLGVLRTVPVSHDAITADLWVCPFIHPTVVFQREKILKIGSYDRTALRSEDYELWFRCAKAGFSFANVPEPLILYRFDRNTHKKQSLKITLNQALIGYRGASLVEMPAWKRLACFVPFGRALLPFWLQHIVYISMRRFDPRNRGHGGN